MLVVQCFAAREHNQRRMNRRTQDLTARELEVLHLIRVGLTNDEIAERLTITSDGVKYHVSQILSKLGVSSRHEAVAAVFRERRQSWWERALASTALRIATGGVAVVVIAFVVLLVFGVLRSGSADRPDISGLTVESVLGSVQQAATKPGQVLHTRVDVGIGEGGGDHYAMAQLWVDPTNKAVRREYRVDPAHEAYDQPNDGTAIVVGDYSYLAVEPGKAHRAEIKGVVGCAGISDAWMAVLLLCGGVGSSYMPTSVTQPRIESGVFRGTSAVVIVYQTTTTGEVPGAPPATAPPFDPGSTGGLPTVPSELETVTLTWRIYLDANDYLPIGNTYSTSAGADRSSVFEAAYNNEFVPMDKEIETLLDPGSIGYGVSKADVEPLLDQIVSKVTVYWLGQDFAGDGLGELVLARILPGEQQGGVQQTYAVGGELVYKAPDGAPEVQLFLWRRADWETFLTGAEGRILTNAACARTEEGEVDGGHSIVYQLPQLQFVEPSRTPMVVSPGGTPAPPPAPQTPEPPLTPGPNESQCNFERSQTALVDTTIGVAEYGDVVVQARSNGYVSTPALMRTLLQRLRPR